MRLNKPKLPNMSLMMRIEKNLFSYIKHRFAVKIATFCGVLIAMTSARSLSKRRVQCKIFTSPPI